MMDIPRYRTCCCPLSVSIDSLSSPFNLLDYLYASKYDNDPIMPKSFSSFDETDGSEVDMTPESLSDVEICPHMHGPLQSELLSSYLGDTQFMNGKLDNTFQPQDNLAIFPELCQRFEDDIMDFDFDLDSCSVLDSFSNDDHLAHEIKDPSCTTSHAPCSFDHEKNDAYHMDEVVPSPTKSEEDVFCYDEEVENHPRNRRQCKKRKEKRRRRLNSEDSDTDDSLEGCTHLQAAKREKRHSSSKSRLTVSNNVHHLNKPKAPRPIHLYQFLIDLLRNENYCPRYINWVSRDEGIFRLVDSAAVAQLWGQCKNRENMTYEKMSRALRYYYENGILERVPNCRLQYRFGKVVYEEYGDLL